MVVSPSNFYFTPFLFPPLPYMLSSSKPSCNIEENISPSTFSAYSSEVFFSMFFTQCVSSSDLLWGRASISSYSSEPWTSLESVLVHYLFASTLYVLEYPSLLIISSYELPTSSIKPLESAPYSITVDVINPGLWADYPPSKDPSTDLSPVHGQVTYFEVASVSNEDFIPVYPASFPSFGEVSTLSAGTEIILREILAHVIIFWLFRQYHEVIFMAWPLCCHYCYQATHRGMGRGVTWNTTLYLK